MSLLGFLDSAVTIGQGNYSEIAHTGIDFNNLAPKALDHIESEVPTVIHAKQVLPKQMDQQTACRAIEEAEILDIQAVMTGDYVAATKKQMDSLDAIHAKQAELQIHAMSKSQKIAGRNSDYAKRVLVDGYGRQKLKAIPTGVKVALSGTRGVW